MMHDGIKHSRVQSISLRVGASIDLPIFSQLMSSELTSYLELKDQIKEAEEQGKVPNDQEDSEE